MKFEGDPRRRVLIILLFAATSGGCICAPHGYRGTQQSMNVTVMSVETGLPVDGARITARFLSDAPHEHGDALAWKDVLDSMADDPGWGGTTDASGDAEVIVPTATRTFAFKMGDQITNRNWAFRISHAEKVDYVELLPVNIGASCEGQDFCLTVHGIGPMAERHKEAGSQD